jgi:uncharacterized protein YcfJ
MSNGRQIGTIVGSLVAAYFTAGTSYAAFAVAAGGAVGGYIGGRLDPQNVQGPRIDDLKVTNSNYGVGITELDGTERIGGNVIWSTDKMEIATEEEVGKGSGDTQTTYKYQVHMRVGLIRTPADGSTARVLKILSDGKLIWDATSGQPIGSAFASDESPLASAVLYQGDAAQLPDAYEESILGVGNVPAYRELVSLSIRNLDCPGGRVPQLSFVVSTTATTTDEVHHLCPNSGYSAWTASDRVYSFTQTLDRELTIYSGGNDYSWLSRYLVLPDSFGASRHTFWTRPIQDAIEPRALYLTDNTDSYQTYLVHLDSGIVDAVMDQPKDGLGVSSEGAAAYDQALGRYVMTPGSASPAVVFGGGGAYVVCDAFSGLVGSIAMYAGVIYAIVSVSNQMRIQTVDALDGQITGTFDPGIGHIADFSHLARSTVTATEHGVYFYLVNDFTQGTLFRFDGASFEELAFAPFGVGAEPDTNLGELLEAGSLLTMYCDGNHATLGPFLGIYGDDYKTLFLDRLTTDSVKVKDVIAARFDSIGETRYSVAGIPDSDVIYGYKRASPTSVRAAIEPLLTAFRIFAVDEDGLLKFKKYEDIVSVASVSFDELGQSERGDDDIFPLARMQEIDLPRSVTVNYIESNLDFQTASENARRETTEAIEDMTVEIPLAMDSSIAKAAAEAILYSRWNAQNTRVAKLSRKYAFVSPGDGLTIEYPRGTTSLWRVTKANDDGARCEFAVEPGDAALFAKTAVGTTGYEGQQVSPLAPPTVAEIIDGPILRDADNNAGVYVAMEGANSDGWGGAELFAGADDTALVSKGTVSNEAIIGTAENALGTFTLNIFDELNTLTVNVGDGELNSATRAAIEGSQEINAFALGVNGRWEYGQFMTATSLGGGRYRLSSLVRGRRGTEHNRGNHAIGDRFVMLGLAGTLRPSWENNDIGLTKSYRAISKGRSFNSASSLAYENTGEGLMPFSPWDARKAKAASNDQTIVWERRSRMATNALRGSVPLGEATEAYSIDFYTSSGFTTVGGTLSATSRSLTITSAQQTSFGLTPGGTLYLRIYQISDVVGRGHYLQTTL